MRSLLHEGTSTGGHGGTGRSDAKAVSLDPREVEAFLLAAEMVRPQYGTWAGSLNQPDSRFGLGDFTEATSATIRTTRVRLFMRPQPARTAFATYIGDAANIERGLHVLKAGHRNDGMIGQ